MCLPGAWLGLFQWQWKVCVKMNRTTTWPPLKTIIIQLRTDCWLTTVGFKWLVHPSVKFWVLVLNCVQFTSFKHFQLLLIKSCQQLCYREGNFFFFFFFQTGKETMFLFVFRKIWLASYMILTCYNSFSLFCFKASKHQTWVFNI